MKWAYSVKNKAVASFALLSLCLLVLFSNYIDRDHTEDVKNSISTLYEDRLIAEVYILKMTSAVYQIKEQLNADSAADGKSIHTLIAGIRETYDAYEKTKFTEIEKVKANEFFNALKSIESTYKNKEPETLRSADNALAILSELSAIQLEVSKQIMTYAETLYQSGKTSSQFVFAVIIVILCVLQGLVFASKTLRQQDKPDVNLN